MSERGRRERGALPLTGLDYDVTRDGRPIAGTGLDESGQTETRTTHEWRKYT